MLSIGGVSEQKMVANIAQQVYGYNLQATTTWKGVNDKKDKQIVVKHPIMSTKIPQIIAGNIVLSNVFNMYSYLCNIVSDVCKVTYPTTTTHATLTAFRSYMMHFKDHKQN